MFVLELRRVAHHGNVLSEDLHNHVTINCLCSHQDAENSWITMAWLRVWRSQNQFSAYYALLLEQFEKMLKYQLGIETGS